MTEPPMYRIICDERGDKFYKGHGLWTEDCRDAQVFNGLTELMEECTKAGITRCKVVEVSPRTGTAFGLYL